MPLNNQRRTDEVVQIKCTAQAQLTGCLVSAAAAAIQSLLISALLCGSCPAAAAELGR